MFVCSLWTDKYDLFFVQFFAFVYLPHGLSLNWAVVELGWAVTESMVLSPRLQLCRSSPLFDTTSPKHPPARSTRPVNELGLQRLRSFFHYEFICLQKKEAAAATLHPELSSGDSRVSSALHFLNEIPMPPSLLKNRRGGVKECRLRSRGKKDRNTVETLAKRQWMWKGKQSQFET